MNTISRLAVILLASALAGPAVAQQLPSPDALRQQASEQSTLLDQYREILRDPDANLRLSAFTQLVAVEDPVVRQIAYEEGFASSDALLRAMALKYSLFDRTEIIVRVPESSQVPYTLRLGDHNLVSGDFKYSYGGWRQGRVQGLTLQISIGNCIAELHLDDANMLSGEMVCPDETLPVTIDLRGS